MALIHDVIALQVSRYVRHSAPMSLAAFGTLRAYARGWGMMKGLALVASGVGRNEPGGSRR